MHFSRWISIFIITVIICTGAFCGFNIITDPFGVFGDPLFHWYDYNMTQNPRVAKIAYLDKNHEKYDSYIIGCSKTGGIPVEGLNEQYDAKFFSMLMYGGDMYDIRKTAEYILANYDTKNIVLNLGLEEALTSTYCTETDPICGNLHCKVDGSNPLFFYGKYLFANPSYGYDKIISRIQDSYVQNAGDVFIAKNGTYDKRRRDAEHISDTESYLALNNEAFPDISEIKPQSLTNAEQCLNDIQTIKNLCEAKGVSFTLIIDPVSDEELSTYNQEELKEYWFDMAKITDYWNFGGYSTISGDPRYFYDTYHFRTAVGSLILDKMNGHTDSTALFPEFGAYITEENAQSTIDELLAEKEIPEDSYTVTVPILMYHSVSELNNDSTVSPLLFEDQIRGLKEAGYEGISFDELISYVETGTDLPEKPIIITFDDGYSDNYTTAYPILQKYGFHGTIAVIGSSVGKDTYKDTNIEILPHFSYNEAKEMIDSGMITIATHGYDIHQTEAYEKAEARTSATTRLSGETEEEFITFFRKDYQTAVTEIEEATNQKVTVYAYPNGEYNDLTEILLMEMGNKVSLGVETNQNVLIKGLPQSMRTMYRYSINNDYSAADLIKLLEGVQ